MASPFVRSLRALETRGSRRWLPAVIATALIGAWLSWFFLSRVPLYETSALARVEASAAAHPVDARLPGRITRVDLTVGRAVAMGDVLVEMEADAERLALEEARSRFASLGPEIAAVRREIAAEEEASLADRQAASVARDEQRAILRESEAALALAEDEAQRTARLRAQGLIADVDDARARSEAARRRAAADAAGSAVSRVERDEKTRLSDRLVRIQRLRGTLSRLDGEAASAQATIRRLEYEVERRILRAPIAGRIAEAADLRIGAVVEEGDRLAAIVPDGPLRVVAQFPPAAVIGRVRPGQPGRLRLLGFPWTEYGSLAAIVTGVSDEVRDGLIRVELSVAGRPMLPLTHGLPGNVEIEVEHVRPARLVLRTLGGFLTRPAVTDSAPRAGG